MSEEWTNSREMLFGMKAQLEQLQDLSLSKFDSGNVGTLLTAVENCLGWMKVSEKQKAWFERDIAKLVHRYRKQLSGRRDQIEGQIRHNYERMKEREAAWNEFHHNEMTPEKNRVGQECRRFDQSMKNWEEKLEQFDKSFGVKSE